MERIRIIYKRQISLLPLLGLVPSFLLATYSLMLPWAKGRALLFLGINRSPGAALLLAITLAGMVGASVVVATRGKRREPAAAVHLVTAVLMAAVAALAYRMIRHAPTKFLGVVPVASIHPGPGLKLFIAASALVMSLGFLEMAVARSERGRRPVGGAPGPGRGGRDGPSGSTLGRTEADGHLEARPIKVQ